MPGATATLRKWRAVFSIFFQDGIAYRSSGIIWVLTDVTTAITMPMIWIAAARSNGGVVGGFTIDQMVVYYLAMLLLNCFITSHVMWEIAMEVKEGQFSTALLRPISYYQFTFLRSLAWRVIRPALFLPFLLVIGFAFREFLAAATFHVSPAFLLSVVLGHLVSFSFVMAMAAIAFFTQEVYSIFEIYYIPQMLLSGTLFPIAVLPGWIGAIPRALPFYYTVGAPTDLLVGRVTSDHAWHIVAIQVAWVAVLYFGGKLLWRSGLRRYAGVGM
jgi:ABC-2 type transport system permease protein